MRTPCKAACKNDGGICSGCMRTMEEIGQWRHLSDEDRDSKMAILDKSDSTHTCPTCGEGAHCDIAKGKETCWCFDLEKRDTSSIEKSDTCMCRSCLSRLPIE
ncbi:cysteine-rich CWC family protein [Vibrio maerlii]|uniref:cysteine-rich CWC family protein n=1 Tax=Vibrio maerlii TaxID=2231648 RepID=UPI000E3E43DA|nr:cysteine-rich CWC family protein [Vibrio maerlii]